MKPNNLKQNEFLSRHTTFQIGGPAKYFFEAAGPKEIKKALEWAEEKGMPVLILGGGSNVLISDDGFTGLVIKIKSNNLKINDERVIAEAGASLTKLAVRAAGLGLSGLEWAAGIPGTVGGAVRGNAGAWGGEIGDTIESVKVLRGGREVILKNKDCGFAYRHSIFKANNDIILEVVLKLKKGEQKKSQELINKYLQTKSKTQAIENPSSGCIFKNIEFTELDKKTLEKIKPLLNEDLIKRRIVPAGLLIDEAEFRGFKMGKVMVSQKHANFIINLGGGTAEQVVMLVAAIKQKVRVKFDIQLREEIQLVGL